ncbi:MAG: hypothetical protein VX519_10900 [Myxococcota bacterium]|nr:hypothetical protein [Myxococcota bacterium]
MTKNRNESRTASVGDLVSLFYEEYLALYGDEELASLAAAATVNDILCEQEVGRSKMAPSLEEAA